VFKNCIRAWDLAGGNFNMDTPYPAVRRWVLYQTIVDLLDSLELSKDATSGQTKILGDLQIKYDPSKNARKIEDLLKKLEVLEHELRMYRGNSPVFQSVGIGVRNPAERRDFMMRTWDYLYGTKIESNTRTDRAMKQWLSGDHHFHTRVVLSPGGTLFQCRRS